MLFKLLLSLRFPAIRQHAQVCNWANKTDLKVLPTSSHRTDPLLIFISRSAVPWAAASIAVLRRSGSASFRTEICGQPIFKVAIYVMSTDFRA